MYRAVTFAALRRGIDPADADAVARLVQRRRARRCDPTASSVDGVDATIEIRGPEVSRAVSIVAANPAVRTEMVRRQREWAADRGGGVLEGRDIGTVVFPDADAEGVPDRRSRGAGRSAARRRSPTSTTRRWPPTWPGATPSTRAARTARSTEADDAVVVDTTGLRVDEIVDVHRVATEPIPMAEPRPGDDVEIWTGPPTGGTRLLLRHRPRADPRWRRQAVRSGARSSAPRRSRPTGAFILAPVHRCNIDFALASLVTRRPHALHGQGLDLEVEALGRFVVDARRLPRAPRHGRPRGAASLHGHRRAAASRW